MKELIKINYKSGTSETYWFKKFDAKYEGGSITSLTWESANGAIGPIFIGISNIESVYQLDYSNED